MKVKKYVVDVDRLECRCTLYPKQGTFLRKQTTKPKANYMLITCLLHIAIISLWRFFLMKRENEGIFFQSEI